MPVQINIWLLLFGALQGLLLSLVLIKNKTYRVGYGFLIAYLLVMLAQILFKVADKHWLMEGMRTTYFLSYKFPFLYGPLIWLFTRGMSNISNKLSVRDALHFLPFIYSVIVLNMADDLVALPWLYWPMKIAPAFLLQLVSLFYYHSLALKWWKEHCSNAQGAVSNIYSLKADWIKKFISFSLFLCMAISVITYLLYVWYPAHNWLRFGFILLCIFIYWISYAALQQPGVLGKSESNLRPLYIIPVLPTMIVHRPAKKYANSTLKEDEAARIMVELETAMAKQKMFAEPELTIEQLAGKLCTNRYVLSQVLNERLSQSFYEYINGYRVEAAREMLAGVSFKHYKIAAIGYEAGFNSLSTFNEVFKKITGITPSQYKKEAVQAKEKQRV